MINRAIKFQNFKTLLYFSFVQITISFTTLHFPEIISFKPRPFNKDFDLYCFTKYNLR